VEDHCQAILEIFNNGKVGEKYNIGGECEVANIDLVKTIIRLMGASEDLIVPLQGCFLDANLLFLLF
jgi:dTDP-glucose 4,6-dehydratase